MEIMVNNLHTITPQSLYIETPFALLYANMSNIAWHHILNFCSSQVLPKDTCGTFLFPTFTGSIDYGHWHLTIVHKQYEINTGFIIDSLGINQNRIQYSRDVIENMGINISQWTYIPCVKQDELGCGPQTITHI